MGRFNFDTKATRKRLSYASSKGSYGTGTDYYGFFTPVENDANTIALNIMGQAWAFYTDPDADILASDSLTINSVDYQVRGVRRFNQKRNDFLECMLERAVTD